MPCHEIHLQFVDAHIDIFDQGIMMESISIRTRTTKLLFLWLFGCGLQPDCKYLSEQLEY